MTYIYTTHIDSIYLYWGVRWKLNCSFVRKGVQEIMLDFDVTYQIKEDTALSRSLTATIINNGLVCGSVRGWDCGCNIRFVWQLSFPRIPSLMTINSFFLSPLFNLISNINFLETIERLLLNCGEKVFNVSNVHIKCNDVEGNYQKIIIKISLFSFSLIL